MVGGVAWAFEVVRRMLRSGMESVAGWDVGSAEAGEHDA